MSIARFAAWVQTQKLNRSTSETSEAIAFACLTRSRTYCHGSDTPRFGFALSQCGPSACQESHAWHSSEGNHRPAVAHGSHGSSPQMNANHASFVMVPSSTSRLCV